MHYFLFAPCGITRRVSLLTSRMNKLQETCRLWGRNDFWGNGLWVGAGERNFSFEQRLLLIPGAGHHETESFLGLIIPRSQS